MGVLVTLYSVSGDSGSMEYFGTLREATSEARSRSAVDRDVDVHVERCRLVPLTKATVIRLCNSAGGFVDESTIVSVWRAGRRVQQ